ncbi:MAG: hypothetical protein J0I23_31150 [Rhizobiales bacterium]|nr:hypothetical protein [Hyphomicrobiales bacterium]
MKPTNAQMSAPLTVTVEDGQLKISIGIALLAFAVQSPEAWPEDFYICDIPEFAKSMARRLQREEEDGTTLVHRMLDAAADEALEQGDDGFDEGKVQAGIDIAKSILNGKAA